MHKLIITPKTKVGELLDSYPELEPVLIKLAPAFKKLKNPILRKTVGKIATLQQAAAVGNISIEILVNTLRKEVGQDSISEATTEGNYLAKKPVWFDKSKITNSFDATTIINSGENPMPQVFSEIKKIDKGEIFELITPFVPAPIIDKLIEKGYECWVDQEDESTIRSNFIKKS